MKQTARVYMLGNAFELSAGQEYDLPMDRANSLCGLGYAIMIDAAEPAKEEPDAL